MDKRKRILGLYMALMVSLSTTVLSGCFLTKNESPDNGGTIIVEPQKNKEESNVPGESGIEEKNSLEEDQNTGIFQGDIAYDFVLVDREGNEIRLSDLKGKVVLMSFWTTWSNYATYQMPFIQQIYNHYDNKDVVVLAVNVLAAEKKDQAGVNQFIDENGYSFPLLYDVDGSVAVKYKVSTFPTTYIIDQEGKISDMMSVVVDNDVIMDKIEKTLNQ